MFLRTFHIAGEAEHFPTTADPQEPCFLSLCRDPPRTEGITEDGSTSFRSWIDFLEDIELITLFCLWEPQNSNVLHRLLSSSSSSNARRPSGSSLSSFPVRIWVLLCLFVLPSVSPLTWFLLLPVPLSPDPPRLSPGVCHCPLSCALRFVCQSCSSLYSNFSPGSLPRHLFVLDHFFLPSSSSCLGSAPQSLMFCCMERRLSAAPDRSISPACCRREGSLNTVSLQRHRELNRIDLAQGHGHIINMILELHLKTLQHFKLCSVDEVLHFLTCRRLSKSKKRKQKPTEITSWINSIPLLLGYS